MALPAPTNADPQSASIDALSRRMDGLLRKMEEVLARMSTTPQVYRVDNMVVAIFDFIIFTGVPKSTCCTGLLSPWSNPVLKHGIGALHSDLGAGRRIGALHADLGAGRRIGALHADLDAGRRQPCVLHSAVTSAPFRWARG